MTIRCTTSGITRSLQPSKNMMVYRAPGSEPQTNLWRKKSKSKNMIV